MNLLNSILTGKIFSRNYFFCFFIILFCSDLSLLAKEDSNRAEPQGFIIKSTDGKSRMMLTGYLNLDSRSYFNEEPYIVAATPAEAATPDVTRDYDVERQADYLPYLTGYKRNPYRNKNAFLLRRVRLIAQGDFSRIVEFRIMGAWDEGSTSLFDAYLDFNLRPWFKLRVGKYKSPIGLERLQSATALAFIERGLPTSLAPNRDVGVMIFGNLYKKTICYNIALLNGSVDNGNENNDIDNNKEIVIRFFAHPFKLTNHKLFKELGIGIAGTHGSKEGKLEDEYLPSYPMPAQDRNFFTYYSDSTDPLQSTVANGEQTRIYPQMYYYYGRFGMLAEWVKSEQRVSRLRENNLNTNESCTVLSYQYDYYCRDHAMITNTAWQIAVSFLLTNDRASYEGIIPASPFIPGGSGWGAFEIKVRYGETVIDRDAFGHSESGGDAFTKFVNPSDTPSRAKAWTVGFNWIFNRHFRLMVDFSKMSFYSIDEYKSVKESGEKNIKFSDERVIFARISLKY